MSSRSNAQLEEAERVHIALGRHSFRFWWQACCRIPLKNAFGEDGNLDFPVMTPLQYRLETALEQQQADGMPMRTLAVKVRQDGSSRFHMNRAYWMGRNYPIEVAVIGDDLKTTPRLLNMWEIAHKEDKFGDHRWGNAVACEGFPRKFSHGTQLWEETANDPRAGQGGTPQVLVSSETAHYKSKGQSTGEAVFQSIANSVPDLPGTWIALESTANGKQGVYYKTYQKAVTLAQWVSGLRGNGYIKCFSAWYENADYDDTKRITQREAGAILESLTERETRLIERYGPKKITPGRLAWRRRKLIEPNFSGDEDKFDQEYPSDIDIAFISSGVQVFDLDGLAVLKRQSESDLPKTGRFEKGVFTEMSITESTLRLWERPMMGRSYLIAADFMEGEQSQGKKEQDCHAVGVWRAAYVDENGLHHRTKLVAAIRPECRVNLDILCAWIGDLHRWYGECLVVPEVNSAFGIIELLATKGVQNVWLREQSMEERRVGEGKQIRKRGFKTTELTREQMISNAQMFVREQEFEASCPRLVEEFENFITLASGRKEAAGGYHDDWVMMSMIALLCMPAATRMTRHAPVVVRQDGVVTVDDFLAGGGRGMFDNGGNRNILG